MRRYLNLLLAITLIFGLIAATFQIQNNYQCSVCWQIKPSSKEPSSGTCPKGTPGAYGHYWRNLGQVGDTEYKCLECQVRVYSKTEPNAVSCPKGRAGAHGHSWDKVD